MNRWRCPGCHQTIEANAVAVGHECAALGDRITDWTRTDLPVVPTPTERQQS